jgi:hypothetical protein
MRGLRRDFVQANIAPVGQGIATDDLRFSRPLLPKLLRQTRFLAVFGLERAPLHKAGEGFMS